MFASTYLLVNTGCIIIMLLILRVHLRSLDNGAPARVFAGLVCAMLAYSVFDMLCGLIENGAMPTNQFVSSVLNVGFFWTGSLTSYLAFAYGEYELRRPWIMNDKTRLIGKLPLYITLVLTVLTLKYRYFYYIDEQGNYIKGPYYVFVMVCGYGYIAIIGIVMLCLLRQKRYYIYRKKIRTLASFMVYPLVAGLIQSMHTGISLICMGSTIAVIQVFIDMQETRITMDTLTNMNNRERLMQALESSLAKTGQQVYFLMMNLDNFRDINDKYGRLEGDSAIVDFAELLKRVGSGYNCVLARYGGDEFAALLLPEENNDDYVLNFKTELRRAIGDYNVSSGKPYILSISTGWAKNSQKLCTTAQLVEAANREMYKEKFGHANS